MTPKPESLYRRVLGADFERLRKPFPEMRRATTVLAACGRCDIERGRLDGA